MSLSNDLVLQPVGKGFVLRQGSLQKMTAGVDTQIVSTKGFNRPKQHFGFCNLFNLKHLSVAPAR